MKAGPTFLQFDQSKAGLSMDLPVLVYSHTKTSLTFFQDKENVDQLFVWLKIFNFKPLRKNVSGLLVLCRPESVKVY